MVILPLNIWDPATARGAGRLGGVVRESAGVASLYIHPDGRGAGGIQEWTARLNERNIGVLISG